MEKTQKLLTRLGKMSPGIFGLITIALFAAGYHRSAFMLLLLGGSTVGSVTVLIAVVLFAIREKPFSVPRQIEAVGAGRRPLEASTEARWGTEVPVAGKS